MESKWRFRPDVELFQFYFSFVRFLVNWRNECKCLLYVHSLMGYLRNIFCSIVCVCVCAARSASTHIHHHSSTSHLYSLRAVHDSSKRRKKNYVANTLLAWETMRTDFGSLTHSLAVLPRESQCTERWLLLCETNRDYTQPSSSVVNRKFSLCLNRHKMKNGVCFLWFRKEMEKNRLANCSNNLNWIRRSIDATLLSYTHLIEHLSLLCRWTIAKITIITAHDYGIG